MKKLLAAILAVMMAFGTVVPVVASEMSLQYIVDPADAETLVSTHDVTVTLEKDFVSLPIYVKTVGMTSLTVTVYADGLKIAHDAVDEAFADGFTSSFNETTGVYTVKWSGSEAVSGELILGRFLVYIPKTLKRGERITVDMECPRSALSSGSPAVAYQLSTAATDAQITIGPVSGKIGDVQWSVDGTELVISGRGEIPDFKEAGPWGQSITKVTVGEGITKIGKCAFEECTSLTEAILPKSLKSIGARIFYNCKSLEKVELPDNIELIPDEAFYYCQSLTSVTFPKSLREIGFRAFDKCYKLTSAILPEGLTNIGSAAFNDCRELARIVFPHTLEEVEADSFRETAYIKALPNGFVCFGNLLYSYSGSCPEELTIPENVTRINMRDPGVKTLYWNKVKTLHFPKTISDINPDFSRQFGNVVTVTVDEANPYYYCEGNCIIEKATGTLVFGATDAVIPDDGSVKAIGENAFYEKDMTELTIPEGVTTIGDCAFTQCDKLTKLILPESLRSIGRYAFQVCKVLTQITIPEGVTDIPNGMLSECRKLEKVSLPSTVRRIGDKAFNNCFALSDITLNEGLETIGTLAFYNCKALTSVTLPTTLTKVEGKSGEDPFTNSAKTVYYYEGTPVNKFPIPSSKLKKYRAENPDIPEAPKSIVPSGTYATLTLCDNRPQDYSFDGVQWKNGAGYIGGLKPDTEYTVYLRYSQTATTYAGEKSAPFTFRTTSETEKAPDLTFTIEKLDKTTVTLTPVEGCEYSLNGVDWQSSNVFEGLSPNTEYRFRIRYKSASGDIIPGGDILTVITEALTPEAVGDANGDGVVNAKDVSVLMQYVTGRDVKIDFDTVDLNGDGTVNLKDVAQMLKKLAGWI